MSVVNYLGEWWVSIPLPSVPQTDALPIELQTPCKSRIVVSNHSKVGYEPTLIPDHTGVEESSGNDPQSVSHRSQCLAGMSRRLQGLLSIVLITGLEPITSDVSGRRSHQLSYMSGCGQGRVRSYNPRINSTMLSQLSYLSFLLWGQMELNHQDDVLQTRSGPCRYPLIVHSTGIEPVTCCM